MLPDDNCWKCRNLLSKIGSPPPVFCRAYPRRDGIPDEILFGAIRHDHLLGDETDKVIFERREGEKP